MSDKRIARYRALLADAGLAGAVIRRPANVTYLTGYPATLDRPCFAVIGSARVAVVAPGAGGATQRQLTTDAVAIGYHAPGGTLDRVADVDALSAIALEEALAQVGLAGQHVGIESGDVSARHAAVVDRLATRVELDEQIAAMRRVKDEDELTLIRAAVATTDVGVAATEKVVAAGIDEFDLQNAVVAAMEEVSGVPIDVLGPNNAFLSGPRTMLGAAGATPRRMEQGDLVIVDINPVIRLYKGDTTRTFSVGEPTDEQQRVHDSLVRGLEAAEKLARPGVRACDVFAALVEPIIAAGFGTLRAHGGHALGLEHLERPYIIPGDEMRLAEGMVIALEPAVYLPGIGGLRVEDNYLVTTHGLEVLSHYPRELVRCG